MPPSPPAAPASTTPHGPDAEFLPSTSLFKTLDLQQARLVLGQEVPYLIGLPIEHLWESHPLEDAELENAQDHLIQGGLLLDKHAWNSTIVNEAHFSTKHRMDHKGTIFLVILEIFMAVRDSLQKNNQGCIIKMVHAGPTPPRSDRASTHRPDAFLLASTEESPKPREMAPFYWRDLVCPFEYKFGDGDVIEVRRHKPTTRKNELSYFYL